MDPKIWGPGLWKYIHSAAATSSSQQKRLDFEVMIKALAKTLPCEKCKAHFIKNLETFPIKNYMASNESLFMWSYLMHDAVNASQNKTGDQRPTFEMVYKNYFDVATDADAVDFKQDYHDPICHDVCTSAMTNDKLMKLSQPKVETSKKNISNNREYLGEFPHERDTRLNLTNTNQMKIENSSKSVKKYVTKRNV